MSLAVIGEIRGIGGGMETADQPCEMKLTIGPQVFNIPVHPVPCVRIVQRPKKEE